MSLPPAADLAARDPAGPPHGTTPPAPMHRERGAGGARAAGSATTPVDAPRRRRRGSATARAVLLGLAGAVGLGLPSARAHAQDDELRLVSVVLRKTPSPADSVRVVDVAVSRGGAVYVLLSSGVIEKHQGGRRVATIQGSAVPRSRGYGDGPAIAAGPPGQVYVFDRRLNAVSLLDDAGRVVRRATVPHRFEPFYSFDVDARGRLYVGAYSEDAPQGQVHLLCERVDCYVRSAGGPRRTADPEAARFFQGGYVSVAGDRVLFATLNPFRLERFDLELRNARTVVPHSDLLPDGEPISYRKLPDGSRQINNRFPQTTGVAQLPDGRILHTAFLPERAASVLQVFDPAGRLEGSSEILGHVRVEGVLPDGGVVLLRSAGAQEVAVYRFEGARGGTRAAARAQRP